MLQNSTFIQIQVRHGEAVSLIDPALSELHCIQGMLWLTEENAGHDVLLAPGDHFSLRQRGRTVIESVGKEPRSIFGIYPAGAQPARLSLRWLLAIQLRLQQVAGGRSRSAPA